MELTFVNWASGEPNNCSNVIGNENRGVFWGSEDSNHGVWNDINENNDWENDGYVIEWDSESNIADSVNRDDLSQYSGNGHYYQAVAGNCVWDVANEAATSAGGHLLTITTRGENDFVYDLYTNAGMERPWMGAKLKGVYKEYYTLNIENGQFQTCATDADTVIDYSIDYVLASTNRQYGTSYTRDDLEVVSEDETGKTYHIKNWIDIDTIDHTTYVSVQSDGYVYIADNDGLQSVKFYKDSECTDEIEYSGNAEGMQYMYVYYPSELETIYVKVVDANGEESVHEIHKVESGSEEEHSGSINITWMGRLIQLIDNDGVASYDIYDDSNRSNLLFHKNFDTIDTIQNIEFPEEYEGETLYFVMTDAKGITTEASITDPMGSNEMDTAYANHVEEGNDIDGYKSYLRMTAPSKITKYEIYTQDGNTLLEEKTLSDEEMAKTYDTTYPSDYSCVLVKVYTKKNTDGVGIYVDRIALHEGEIYLRDDCVYFSDADFVKTATLYTDESKTTVIDSISYDSEYISGVGVHYPTEYESVFAVLVDQKGNETTRTMYKKDFPAVDYNPGYAYKNGSSIRAVDYDGIKSIEWFSDENYETKIGEITFEDSTFEHDFLYPDGYDTVFVRVTDINGFVSETMISFDQAGNAYVTEDGKIRIEDNDGLANYILYEDEDFTKEITSGTVEDASTYVDVDFPDYDVVYVKSYDINGKLNLNRVDYPSSIAYDRETGKITLSGRAITGYKLIDDTEDSTIIAEKSYTAEEGYPKTVTIDFPDGYSVIRVLLYTTASNDVVAVENCQAPISYVWVTGEAMDYTNWYIDEPSGDENGRVGFFNGNYWNDFSDENSWETEGYIVEWESADAIADTVDMPEVHTFSDNGHYYMAVSGSFTWTEADTAAKAVGGHLATITSAEENEFAYSLCNGNYWLGAYLKGTDYTA